jgi:valyl-tRNA synthetase
LDLAAHALYQFVWRELCDWYVELAKPALRSEADPAAREAAQGSLGLVLDVSLRLLHPIAPFVTEEIWGRLPRMPGDPESLMIAAYPRLAGEHMAGPFPAAPAFLAAPGTRRACDDVELLIGIVQKVRNLKAEMRVPPATRVDVLLAGDRAAIEDRLSRVGAAAAFVGRFSSLRALSSGEAVPAESASDVVGEVEVVLVLAGLVDLAQERARLAKEIRKHEGELAGLERKLADSGFLAKAPEAVVAKERARRDELAQALVRQRAIVDRLGG